MQERSGGKLAVAPTAEDATAVSDEFTDEKEQRPCGEYPADGALEHQAVQKKCDRGNPEEDREDKAHYSVFSRT
ncbi:MAG: hypothetical protein JU82_10160 [Sulfuricurvum sp. MLSB]|nr:MAG: hypothetical protein JU82_10160 [Sulfuricurvum sp. MLSB]